MHIEHAIATQMSINIQKDNHFVHHNEAKNMELGSEAVMITWSKAGHYIFALGIVSFLASVGISLHMYNYYGNACTKRGFSALQGSSRLSEFPYYSKYA